MQHATMPLETAAPWPDAVGVESWVAPDLPHALRDRVEIVFEVLAHLPLQQPLAVVSDAGKTVAANLALLQLLGAAGPDIVGRTWSRVMPAWPDRARRFRCAGEQAFEDHLAGVQGDSVWVRVSLGPIAARGSQRPLAYVLFISRPDVEAVSHEEVRRLRKSLRLLAATRTDYVVEVDREALVTYVSPSYCTTLGVSEQELIGRPFAGRILAADKAAVAAALDQAGRPPFAAEMSARLAVDPEVSVSWQIDAVIGDGPIGLDLVGRPAARAGVAPGDTLGREARPAPAAAPRDDARLAPIRTALDGLRPGDEAGLRALARAVGEAAGVECVAYSVRRGEAVEQALGWRLPSV